MTDAEAQLYKDLYEKNSEGICAVHKLREDFQEFKEIVGCHIARDESRDEKITNLIKVITIDNGKRSVLSRLRTLEDWVTYIKGGVKVAGIIIVVGGGAIWAIVKFIVPLIIGGKG